MLFYAGSYGSIAATCQVETGAAEVIVFSYKLYSQIIQIMREFRGLYARE